jgi:hypothetical protein
VLSGFDAKQFAGRNLDRLSWHTGVAADDSDVRAAVDKDSFASRRKDELNTDHSVDGKKSCAAKAKKNSADRSVAPKKEAAELSSQLTPDWIILSDWKCGTYFQEYGLEFMGSPEAVASIANWRWWLEHFAGSPEKVPVHLYTPAAYRQMLEIVHELAARSNREFDAHRAMIGFAFAVCQALAKGRRINSFAFIVQGLARKLHSGDDTWAFDFPTKMPQARFDEAYQLAAQAIDVLQKSKWSIDRRELLATDKIENLAWLIGKFGHDGVVAGLNLALNGIRRPSEGRRVAGWNWFDHEIESVAHDRQIQAEARAYQTAYDQRHASRPRSSSRRKKAASKPVAN